MSDLWSRRNVIATTLVGLLTCTVTLAIFLFGRRDQEIGTQVDRTDASSESSTTTSPSVSIVSMYVSEVAMDIPASFELGIQAGGATNLAVQDIRVILDFGKAEIEDCDYVPEQVVANIVSADKGYRHLQIGELQQRETLHIRCLISSPVFNQVIIAGGNIYSDVSIDFEQYQERQRSESGGFWIGLFYFFVIFFTIMFCLKSIGFLFPRQFE